MRSIDVCRALIQLPEEMELCVKLHAGNRNKAIVAGLDRFRIVGVERLDGVEPGQFRTYKAALIVVADEWI